MDSIIESSIYNDYGKGSISTNNLEDIQYGRKIHPELNARGTRFKICDHNIQMQGEWKVEELSAKIMGKCLNQLFKAIVNELNNSLTTLGE